MSPKKDETAVHCCHCRGDMVVHAYAQGTGYTAELVVCASVHNCGIDFSHVVIDT